MPNPPKGRVFGERVEIRRHPLVPEIPLFLLAREVDLTRHIDQIFDVDLAPCWPFAWGGGAALARHVLDHPEIVRGLHVVDFGAGSGIVGIAAALAGAAEVICVDLDDDALEACRVNAELASVTVEVSRETPESWDLLLAADVLYASDNAAILGIIAKPGRRLLLAESHRPGARKPRRAELAGYDVKTFPDVDVPVERASIYVFEGSEAWSEAFAEPPGSR